MLDAAAQDYYHSPMRRMFLKDCTIFVRFHFRLFLKHWFTDKGHVLGDQI